MLADQQALRSAEIALYAACSGDDDAAALALAAAGSALQKSDAHRRRSIRARVLMALAEIVRGHESTAHRFITDAENALDPSMHRMRALTNAARSLYRVWLGQADPQVREAAFARLSDQHLEGLARVMRAIPVASTGEAGIAVLTQAEREVLQLLASGSSTKQIAAKTGRSPHTVDTHIRSICRKLDCSGRREAVALATSRGWVQTGPMDR
jgi:DNA-binding CsgD family transcriptional regulator